MLTRMAPYLVIGVMALGVVLRSYQINAPLADWHSWRQVDTASVARQYVKTGIDLLRPTYHDLGSIPSGLDNPEGYRYVEFPIISALHAYLAGTFPNYSLVFWGRILSIISSTLTIGLVYLIMRHVSTPLASLASALAYAVLPYNIFYGRVILPEPHLVFFMLSALYSFLKYWDKPRLVSALTYTLMLTLALLMKPTALVVLLPIGLYSLMSGTWNIKKSLVVTLLTAGSLIPYALWRNFMAAYPAGIPANSWLFNGNGIRFKGAFFRWLFGDRLGRLILGYTGMIPFAFGLIGLGRSRKELAVVGGLCLGALLYLVVIATGNVQHDYYQIQIMPVVAMIVGLGLDYALSLKKGLAKLTTLGIVGTALVLGVALGWYEVRGFFNINNPAIVAAGSRIDAITPADTKVIAPYMGDTAFLFQTNRTGWPIGGNIEDKIKAGAVYYVTTTRDKEYNDMVKTYELIEETAEYSIIKLTK
jgi:hypothetical protein